MVRLISHTAAPGMTPEQLIVYCARVSNPENQNNFATADRLLKHLIDNGHWSPFEMADFTFEIKTSRAISAQILRHRSFSFQEFSQRYSSVQNVVPIELRRQAIKNRQSSTEAITDESLKDEVTDFIGLAQEFYNKLLDNGVARECARMVLPLSTETTLYMKGSVRSWIHYLKVRMSLHTQKEHRQIAEAIFEILRVELSFLDMLF